MEEKISKQALLSISNIIAMMNTTDTLQQFFAHIQQTLNSITYAENFYLALVDARRKYITFPYYKDVMDDFTAEALDEIPLETIFSTLTFYAMKHKQVCVLSQQDITQLIDLGEVKVLGTMPKQWLCFPLIHKDQFLGVFVIQSYRDQAEYQGVIIDLLTAISFVLASALCAFNNHAALLDAHKALSVQQAKLEELVKERTEALSQTVLSLEQEIARTKSLQQQLEYKAQHDALTGLFNREYLNEVIRRPSSQFGYCAFIDLDGFKAVNDQHGHHIGDLLLVRVADICRSLASKGDILIRNGGDEFIVLSPKNKEQLALQLMLEQILDRLSTLTQICGAELAIGASIGLAKAVSDATLPELVKAADMAMYQAKTAGKHQLVIATI